MSSLWHPEASCALFSNSGPSRALQYHLRPRARLRDLQPERQRVVVDPHHIELLTGFDLPYQHRPTSVQINTDKLAPGVPERGVQHAALRHRVRRP
jgi:hypothetical protein